jgi:hypothetical protein
MSPIVSLVVFAAAAALYAVTLAVIGVRSGAETRPIRVRHHH